MIAGVPDRAPPVPLAIERLAAGRRLTLVWHNELGGQTYEMGTGAGRQFAKWTPTASGIDLSREVMRLAWAASYVRVPRVLDRGADEHGTWIVTAGLPGENAVTDRWRADPATAVAAIGRGLRGLHDTLPVDACPFSWSVEDRLVGTRRLAALGRLDRSKWDPIHRAARDHPGLGAAGVAAADRPAGRLPWRCVLPQHAADRRRLLVGSRRSRSAGRRRPMGRPRGGHLEHAVELRPGLGGSAPRRVRRRARCGADPLLSPPVGRG